MRCVHPKPCSSDYETPGEGGRQRASRQARQRTSTNARQEAGGGSSSNSVLLLFWYGTVAKAAPLPCGPPKAVDEHSVVCNDMRISHTAASQARPHKSVDTRSVPHFEHSCLGVAIAVLPAEEGGWGWTFVIVLSVSTFVYLGGGLAYGRCGSVSRAFSFFVSSYLLVPSRVFVSSCRRVVASSHLRVGRVFCLLVRLVLPPSSSRPLVFSTPLLLSSFSRPLPVFSASYLLRTSPLSTADGEHQRINASTHPLPQKLSPTPRHRHKNPPKDGEGALAHPDGEVLPRNPESTCRPGCFA